MNTIVTITDGQAVTTTEAIAEGAKVEHASVIKLVRSYQSDLEEFGLVRFEIRAREASKHGGGDVEFAILNEQQSTLLLTYMRNSEIVRAFKKQLVKEFWKMAQQLRGQPSIPQTLPEALRLAAEAIERNEKLALENKAQAEALAEQAPKVAFADQVEVAPDAIDLGKAAKLIGTGRTRLMAFMREIRWINRFNQPYQDKIEAGLLDVKVSPWEHPKHGLQQQITTLVFGKGLVKLQSLWNERQHAIGAAHTQPAATPLGSGVQA